MSQEAARQLLGLTPEPASEAEPPVAKPAPDPRRGVENLRPAQGTAMTPAATAERKRRRVANVLPEHLAETLQPWERMHEESIQAYRAFTFYRDLGDERSLIGAYRAAKTAEGWPPARIARVKSPPLPWREWFHANRWLERANAWDLHVDRMTQRQRIKAIEDMQKRHIAVGGMMQNIGVKKLQHIQTEVELNPGAVTLDQSLKLLDQGVKLERQARGEPNDITRHQGDPDHPMMTVDVGKLLADRLRDMAAAIAKGKQSTQQIGNVEVGSLPLPGTPADDDHP